MHVKRYEEINEEIKFGKLGKLALAGGIAATMGLSSCHAPIATDVKSNTEIVGKNFAKSGKIIFSRKIVVSSGKSSTSYVVIYIKTNDGEVYKVIVGAWDSGTAIKFWDFSDNTLMRKGDAIDLHLNGDEGYVVWLGYKMDLTDNYSAWIKSGYERKCEPKKIEKQVPSDEW